MPSRPDEFSKWIHPPLHGVWYLTGPTCSGKTRLALEVAQRLNAEVISMDSMAIYRGMDIGTAKPTREQQAQIRHHLIDILEPTEAFSVSNFVVAAHAAAAEIRAAGKNVLICGGTPLYLKSLLRGLFLGPEADWEFRTAVQEELERTGQDALLARLAQVDPVLGHKLHPHDHRRIIRALEVAKVTGRPLSHWQKQFDEPAPRGACPVVVLKLERSWLHERINTRVEAMLAEGLSAEVAGLVERYGRLGRTAAQAVGYREILQMLEGELAAEEVEAQIKAHTRQFARRQEIWFRGLAELQPIRVSTDRGSEELVSEICHCFDPMTAANDAHAR